MTTPLKFIDIEGDAYTRGVQLGQASKTEIAHSLSVYRQTFDLCNITWLQAKEKASRYHDLIQTNYPVLLAELNGIAKGSGFDVDDLFTLNCRTEILPANFLSKALVSSEVSLSDGVDSGCNECTSFAFNRASSNPVWLAQNWDWIGLQRQALIVVRAKTEQGEQFITVTEAGMLAKIGMNQYGLGICLNILRSRGDGEQAGLPVHFLLRALLDCKSVVQAKTLTTASPFASSSNVMIADRSGDMCNMELSPLGMQILMPENQMLCHTNHFLHPELVKHDAVQATDMSTATRLDTAQAQISSVNDLDGIKSLLSDTSNGVESICRFADPRLPPIAQAETVVGVVMNLSSMELWVSDAQPSVSEFRHYTFEPQMEVC